MGAGNCSAYKLRKSLGQPAQLLAINTNFSTAVEQPLACAVELAGSLQYQAKLIFMHGLLLPRQHAKASLDSGIYF